MGYSANNRLNQSAQTAYNQYGNCAIFSLYGHGAVKPRAGYMKFPNNSYLIAGVGGENNQHPNYYISTYQNQINKVLLAIFAGCHTANTDPGDDQGNNKQGNLILMSANKGVDSVIGFQQMIYYPPDNSDHYGNYFFMRFWMYTNFNNTLAHSLVYARDDLYSLYNQYYGFNSFHFAGQSQTPGAIRLYPVRYGSH